MLSRRSVRIKVMQLLYMLNRDEQLDFNLMVKDYNDGIWKTYELYIFQLYLLLRVTQYAEKDAAHRASKLLPTDDDKVFQPRLYTNPCTQSLANHVEFLNVVAQYKANENIDEDHIRTLYLALADTQEYKNYLALEQPSNDDHVKMLLELYRFLVNHDVYVEMSEDRYNNWPDDESLVVGAMKKTLKAMPFEGPFFKEHEPADETVREFGEQLLRKTSQEDKSLFSLIEPTLKNWDAERVAVLDMIMIKMALCELLHFPTIPTKVTLNEFVEISKVYSTDKSKEFINGVLDRLMKKLIREEKIVKEGRGLIE
ncbi:MAG TPA: transcription antitermination factor NusB [Saprospiraceae bacterium]|nr:transcription antitermination factor NusB [Saprospiraceae bacterium]HND86954.1 transcription antitermination factor NusB [Saprospiraceae bacterium]